MQTVNLWISVDAIVLYIIDSDILYRLMHIYFEVDLP